MLSEFIHCDVIFTLFGNVYAGPKSIWKRSLILITRITASCTTSSIGSQDCDKDNPDASKVERSVYLFVLTNHHSVRILFALPYGMASLLCPQQRQNTMGLLGSAIIFIMVSERRFLLSGPQIFFFAFMLLFLFRRIRSPDLFYAQHIHGSYFKDKDGWTYTGAA